MSGSAQRAAYPHARGRETETTMETVGPNSKILIYSALLSFLRGACDARLAGPSEVVTIRTAIDGYLLSMASDDVVVAVVESLEHRKILLEISSKLGLADDSKFRAALRTDDQGIATLLVSIFNSKSAEDAALRLQGDSAQYFLDVVQNTLDKGYILAQEHTRRAHRIIRKLSESCDMLPSSLFISGVSGCDDHPTFGGGYGDIYRASHNNNPVALKRMRYFLRGSDLRRVRLKFCREALVWKDLQHPHILPFLGIDRDTFPSSLCMVSPWMELGTVMNYLEAHGYANVDRLLYEISQGLQYLHSNNIVHGDLRGLNILINQDFSACLADFGLSVFSDATASMTTNRGGSLYWMAPELIDPERFGFKKFARTPATDVYAYGCVCLELYTGRPPFSQLPEPAALMKILSGERPQRPSGPPAMSDALWRNIVGYWAESAPTRPATEIVVQNMIWPVQVPYPSPPQTPAVGDAASSPTLPVSDDAPSPRTSQDDAMSGPKTRTLAFSLSQQRQDIASTRPNHPTSNGAATPGTILIYEALILFIKDACRARSLSGVAGVQETLDSYHLSDSAVSSIVESLQCRKTLLELASKLGLAHDSRLRSALQLGEKRIAALLVSIFNDKSEEDAVLQLRDDSAQYFLDVVQATLDRGLLMAQEHSRMARRIVRKLSETCDQLPSSIFISGVTGREEYYTLGGGFGNICRASCGGQVVALKYMRAVNFLRGDELRRLRSKFCREALVWKDLLHPYILPFMGIDRVSYPSSLCMVSPWMEHGTVLNYLNDHGRGDVDKLLYEIAQGLEYLHSHDIVHGDLRGASSYPRRCPLPANREPSQIF
ncbi:kinase-like domain-containing protein [Mycena metata]|uniref:Kinase-like domain-containing protein n=1 Tax=Mycena metata TaxID=1033252 RepID=A0AAD7H5H5_9AGAR|nr:kinase-like domain-containing protein [Mycena metata]